MEELEMQIMNIIVYAGDCKNHAYGALRKAKEKNFEEAEKEMKLAEESISKAHDFQTAMIQKEANGEKVELSVLFVHAQDHLMTAMSEKTLIQEIIELRKSINC